MDAILAVAKSTGLKVIEDCAQAHGAIIKVERSVQSETQVVSAFIQEKTWAALGMEEP